MNEVAIVSFAELRGGAAKSANSMYLAAIKRGVSAKYIVVEKNLENSNIIHPNKWSFFWHYFLRIISYLFQNLQIVNKAKSVKRSLNLFSCRYIVKKLMVYNCIHLHWINNDTISIEKLAILPGCIIITLHDEWLYCGSEHYALDSMRPFEGYYARNKNVKGIDLDRVTWERKKKALKKIKDRVVFTVPSTWMEKRARASVLLSDANIHVLPNIIDIHNFKFINNDEIRLRYSITPNKKIILFGAVHGKAMYLKGFSILCRALSLLKIRTSGRCDFILVSFGGEKEGYTDNFEVEHIELGKISNKEDLAKIYSAATLTAVPSIAEAFGQIAAESLSCQTPVVGFNKTGLADIIVHKESGYLAEPYSLESFCDGLEWLLGKNIYDLNEIGIKGRKHIVDNFSEPVVADKLIELYKNICKGDSA